MPLDERKRYLVTGGAGFIGSAVCRHLINETPHHVLVVDKLTYAGNLASLAPISGHARFRFLKADIADAEAMENVLREFKPDVLMHLAAESHVDRSIDRPADFIHTNVVGTFVLLEAAYRYWCKSLQARADAFRFLHVSTDEVFGSLGGDGLFDESSPYRPNSPYAASKAASDHFARAWHRTFGLPVVVSNCSNNYGPYQFPEKFIPLVILNALQERPIPIYGRGDNVRDWLHVEDHARALVLIAERGEVGATYIVGGGNERTNVEMARDLCRLIDELAPAARPRDRLIQFVDDRPGHDLRYAVDSGRIRQELDWAPREDLQGGLRKTVSWYIRNEAWWRPIRERVYAGERLGRRN
ncbi:MAG TPA: dTDP-glucose 4,6-dehydratase [Pseudorhodoplanes sp.]|jgi:dTDP-glucose 4,6-dehydratase|nr:dTDP-glucose 4,6-dehydratase [Pseudorhodoplanes sp.]